jgi:hypothetical protein
MARPRKKIQIGDTVKMTESAKTWFGNKNKGVVFEGIAIVKDILAGSCAVLDIDGRLENLNINFLERVI